MPFFVSGSLYLDSVLLPTLVPYLKPKYSYYLYLPTELPNLESLAYYSCGRLLGEFVFCF